MVPGCFVAGFISDSFGPRPTIFGAAVLIILCDIGLAIQSHYVILIILRSIGGIGIGVMNAMGPSFSGGFYCIGNNIN
jgi:MFS family permease